MTLNIALNTIIIIMVFLFPGIIVRKSFFTNTFKNRYDNGGTLDKIVWNILVSIITLFIFSLLYNLISYFVTTIQNTYNFFGKSDINIEIEYKEIYCIFESLSKNALPLEFENYDNTIKYIFYILLVYLLSFILGKVFYKLVKKSRIEKWFSFLQFSNDWEYLVSPKYSNFSDLKNKNGYTTWVDVLIGDKDKKDLYRGIVERIIYDKENKIENIILKKTIQFIQIDLNDKTIKEENGLINIDGKLIDINSIHTRSESRIVYRKIIAGEYFVIPNKDIKNMNFSYIPPLKYEKSNSAATIQINEGESNNYYVGEIILVGLIVTSIIWHLFDFSKYFINNHRIIDIILQILKGSYLIAYSIIIVINIFNLFKVKKISREILTNLLLVILLSFIMFGILYNIPVIYSVTLSYISVYLGSFIESKLDKYFKEGKFNYAIAILATSVFLYLFFLFLS